MVNSDSAPSSLDGIVRLSPLLAINSKLIIVHDTTHFNELLVSNRANGFRDLLAVIDLSTYRRLSWEKNLPFFLVSFIVPETGDWLAVDPRSALKVVLEKAEEKGWTCMSGAEFEVCDMASRRGFPYPRKDGADGQYFQFKETPASMDEKKFVGLQALTPGSGSSHIITLL
jgi:glutamine synthetase